MNKKGFTLIELLVVIAITAILTSVMVPSLFSTKSKARDTKRISDIAQIQLALEVYLDNNGGVYPTAIYGGPLDPYLSPVPTDPSNNANYAYAALKVGAAPECANYHIGASLEVTNVALSNDKDVVAGNICAGSSADFNANDADATRCKAGDFGTKCYDLGP
jgi:prepilin-type N-terminal cleavage/methylation domain-containing protein